MSWKNQEDFTKDLYMFSENESSPNDEPEPLPPSIAQWNAMNGTLREQSIFDTIPCENDVTMISSGRGRGRCSELYRPGLPFKYSISEDDDIRRRLQECNSHSYSNVNIEAAVRMKTIASNYDDFCDAKESNDHSDNIKVNVSHECSSSSSSPVTENETTNVTPLMPLSQMRQIAKQNAKPKLYSQVLKDKKNFNFKNHAQNNMEK